MLRFRLLFPLFALLLGACSKLESPQPGDYRAHIELGGGIVPFELNVDTKAQLWLVQNGAAQAATELKITDGVLTAQLPNGSGTLQATIGHAKLQGELVVSDNHGKQQHLPFAAELNKPYRFVANSSTDNADVSGQWQFEALDLDHSNAPVTLRLQQKFDAIDGELVFADGAGLLIYGQAQGDDIYLGGLGQGYVLLFKGKVDTHGDLQGQLWINSSTAQTVVVTRMSEKSTESEEILREVALPWAVPTR